MKNTARGLFADLEEVELVLVGALFFISTALGRSLGCIKPNKRTLGPFAAHAAALCRSNV